MTSFLCTDDHLTDISQLNDAIKEAMDWLEENAATAETAEFEEQKEKLSNVAYPITSKLYGSSGGPDGGSATSTEDEPDNHDEL